MKSKSWMIPAAFFLVAAIVNLMGQESMHHLARLTKPALLPLIALCSVAAAGGMESRTLRLLVTAQLFGGLGDILLQRGEFLCFVGGMVAFLVGHVCYIVLFGGKSWKGIGLKVWIPSLLVMAGFVACMILAIGVNGDLLVPMIVYGMTLMLLIFSTLMGVIRWKSFWWFLLCGAVLFTTSDVILASGTFEVWPFAGKDFVIMFTYLAAQCLLAYGGLRLNASDAS